jgi:predicted nucleic acid-binding protein
MPNVVGPKGQVVIEKEIRDPLNIRNIVVDSLISLIHRQNIRLTLLPKLLAVEALQLCGDSNRYSFADVLLWAEARHLQAKGIYTFDQRFPQDVDLLSPEV